MTNKFNLPENPEAYADKYFLRGYDILNAEGINPWVKAQVMIRRGPGKVFGLDEALAILEKYSPLVENKGKVYALNEGDNYAPRETLMLTEAPILDIIKLETMYLGVNAAETTKANDNIRIDLAQVTENARKITGLVGKRTVMYMGARHWRYDEDAAITRAAYEGGFRGASTDIGAATFGQLGAGTTPHVVENIMAWKYGRDRAVVETIKAFDRVIAPQVPRIILCDYRTKEITDTLACAQELGNRLWGPRIDTCGENVGEGAIEFPDKRKLEQLIGKQIVIPDEDEKFWFGRGVTVTGTYAMRKALDKNGYNNMKIVLSSGFADPRKVQAFVRAEEILGAQLFDMLGVGQLFESRASKMDIVGVGEPRNYIPIAKTGRRENPNPRLKLRLRGRR